VITIANYVGGHLLAPAAGRYLEDIEPATGRPYALIPESDAVDLEAAVAAARGAFPGWARHTVEERSRLRLHIAEGIEGEAEALARAESVRLKSLFPSDPNGTYLSVTYCIKSNSAMVKNEFVMPAKAGIHRCLPTPHWTPAFAGVTAWGRSSRF
jgi:Aldehyde dehydrogenase family